VGQKVTILTTRKILLLEVHYSPKSAMKIESASTSDWRKSTGNVVITIMALFFSGAGAMILPLGKELIVKT